MISKQIIQFFKAEEYGKVISGAASLVEPIKSRLVCACHIKNYDIESLQRALEVAPKQGLDFERAYCDYSLKKDAYWYFKSTEAHPKADVLKQQIAYRLKNFQLASESQQSTKNYEQSVNQLACCTRSGVQNTNPLQFKNYEFQYNKALYYFSNMKFQKAIECCEKASLNFDGEETEKDREQIDFVMNVSRAYLENQPFVLPKPYQSAHLNQLYQIFEIIFQIQFSTPSLDALQNIKALLRGNLKLVQSISQNCDATVRFQINQTRELFQVLSANTPAMCKIQGSVFSQVCQAASCIISSHFPSNSLVKREKKDPGKYFETEWRELVESKNYVDISLAQPQSAGNYLVGLLNGVGFKGDCARFMEDKSGCLGGVVNFSDVQECSIVKALAVKQVPIVVIEKVFVKKEAKPMPAKWQKRVSRKVVKHQGVAVNDKVEVAKVTKIPPRRGRGRGRK
ncbi:putative TPR-like repeat-containing protein [Spironucleus salmonicida]|uniref:TPR-like repeat-containing protein n=1 Tax=Spironucleus salmonicida TaxID=348837 RepID=A0A9P8LV46_9EUKA|nr:putative TPR-like repeat-containing protein [Spironucleus salmonicida]